MTTLGAVEGIHLAEDTGEDSGEDGPNQRRSRAHGVLRAGWTVQRGLKGGAFFLNLHTGGTARCQCQEISYKVVCQVHSKPENWRFHDTNSECVPLHAAKLGCWLGLSSLARCRCKRTLQLVGVNSSVGGQAHVGTRR